MSGVKQHYIPKLLLKGWHAQESIQSKKSVWRYTINQEPELLCTKKVAMEVNFHDSLLDNIMTRYENDLAERIASLRKLLPGDRVDARLAAEVVTHLAVRNAHFRGAFAHGLTALVSGVSQPLTNPANIARILGLNGSAPTARFTEVAQQWLHENQWASKAGLPEAILERIAFIILEEKFEKLFKDQIPMIKYILDELIIHSRDLARDGHNKALAKDLAPEERLRYLSTLMWWIIEPPGASVILPDCVAIAFEGDIYCPLMLTDHDKMSAVVLPLSASRALVGCHTGAAFPNLLKLNLAVAKCSQDFFVASKNTRELRALSDMIGQRSWAVVDVAVSEALSKSILNPPAIDKIADVYPLMHAGCLHGVEGEDRNLTNSTVDKPQSTYDLSYQLTFLGCANQEAAEKIAASIKPLISAVDNILMLDRLDGITFAADYPAALRDLDHGFAGSDYLQPIAAEFGIGVAMAPLVIRDDIVKCRIVMRSDFAYALIEEDEEFYNLALHILVYQLAHVGAVGLVERTLPGMLLTRIDDEFDARLYRLVDPAWSSYFAARISAHVYPEAGVGYRKLLIATLERAVKEIPEARFAYRFHGNLDLLLESSCALVGAILRFSAENVGHYDGLGTPPSDQGADLDRALKETGLQDWFDLFSRDLRALWDRRGLWSSSEELLYFIRHVERLLWQFGLFPWRTPEGHCRVEVPLATDAQRLLESVRNDFC